LYRDKKVGVFVRFRAPLHPSITCQIKLTWRWSAVRSDDQQHPPCTTVLSHTSAAVPSARASDPGSGNQPNWLYWHLDQVGPFLDCVPSLSAISDADSNIAYVRVY
jgi:hypothetical protein